MLADADFRSLYVASIASHAGGQVATLGIPLVAVLMLQASELEVGLLSMAAQLALLVLGLPAGAWVDRASRRRVMILSNLGQAAVVALIPLAWWADALAIWQLYLVALLRGVTGLFFNVAYQSYLPHLVGRDNLLEGNTKLEGARSVAQVAGPGLAGQLVQAATAVGALIGSLVMVVVSVLVLGRIRDREPARRGARDTRLRHEIGEGLRFVLGHRLLRPIAACSGTFNLFWAAYLAMFVVFLARGLDLSGGAIGVVMMVGGAGGIVGLFVNRRIVGRLGQGPTLWVTPVLVGLFALLVPLTRPGPTVWIAALGQLLAIASMIVYNVTQVTFRQGLTPDRLLGRMSATMRFLVWGTMPFGALLGGVLGQWLGPRTALLVSAVGVSFSAVPVLLSPLRRMRELPVLPAEDDTAEEDTADRSGVGEPSTR
ncbi:MFS transporter [Plantactinospora endophytica]|uniref:MFS transporter n=1 Tax=Plantactinospora endophytica TaxID=673535 RepID=UPI0023B3230E|nr:MFS transporter [Plantactinospora endophytica]